MKLLRALYTIRTKLKINLVRKSEESAVIEEVNMCHYSVNIVLTMELFTKLLLFIHLKKIRLRKAKSNIEGNDDCNVNNIWFIPEPVGGSFAFHQLRSEQATSQKIRQEAI